MRSSAAKQGARAGLRLLSLLPLFLSAPSLSAQEPGTIVLTTTTSVRDAGLLGELIPPFEHSTGYVVKIIAVGSGQAMELGRRGESDLLILHAPAGELKFLSEGYGVDRRPLMHNEFVILGPRDDPAAVRGKPVRDAFRSIAATGVPFVSRGDGSGTHIRELELWRASGVAPDQAWYRETGQGMGATLVIAHELRAYTLTDIGTLLAHNAALQLDILVSGDSSLFNSYHVIRANPDRFPWVNAAGARALADYLVSREVQQRIAAFRREEFGRSLFVPDALAGQRN